MPSFDYSQFEKSLLKATRQVIQSLNKKKEAKDVCAFALYSDESGSSISASANTSKYLAKVQKEDPEDPLYYKWNPAEWKFDGIENKRLDQLSDQLSTFSMELEEVDLEQYVPELVDTCLNVLLTMKEEKLFDDFHEEFILLFDISDYDNKENQLSWAKQLNDESTSKEFDDWSAIPTMEN